jgi:2-thiouracil desulfurase
MNDDSPVRRPIRVGISACLPGKAVRFDGGHKRDPFLTETFGAFVEWVPVCPEVECGFGTPREAMRLVRVDNDVHDVRLLTVRTAVDLWRNASGSSAVFVFASSSVRAHIPPTMRVLHSTPMPAASIATNEWLRPLMQGASRSYKRCVPNRSREVSA